MVIYIYGSMWFDIYIYICILCKGCIDPPAGSGEIVGFSRPPSLSQNPTNNRNIPYFQTAMIYHNCVGAVGNAVGKFP